MDPITAALVPAMQQLSLEPAVREEELFYHLELPLKQFSYSQKVIILEYLPRVSVKERFSKISLTWPADTRSDIRSLLHPILEPLTVQKTILEYWKLEPVCSISAISLHCKAIKRLKRARNYYVIRVDEKLSDAEKAHQKPHRLRGKELEYFVACPGRDFEPLCSINPAYDISIMIAMKMQVEAHSSSQAYITEIEREAVLDCGVSDEEYIQLLAQNILDKRKFKENIQKLIDWIAATPTHSQLFYRLRLIDALLAKDTVVQFRLGLLFLTDGCNVADSDSGSLAEHYIQKSYAQYPHAAAAALLGYLFILNGQYQIARGYVEEAAAKSNPRQALWGTLQGIDELIAFMRSL